ncbi:DMT family transporter [Fictibacillus fluitans]|uniref:DMT family transporter n=1 Tax=Fictibacillus fluitans TaxID=3058422 RepID=A0ABT8HS36_9BACL|nr:DMT family transporter [Fictibacillus sp. NE201]MDN4523295.1 DMT family transporter [Fictibacillus sp. NE201]
MKKTSPWLNAFFIAVLVMTWGVTWPISKVALSDCPPILLSGFRSLGAGVLLFVFSMNRLDKLHFRENWKMYFLSALFNSVLFYGLQTIGLLFVPAGLFSVIVYLQPVLIGIIAWLWIGESMTALKLTGLLLGFAGVATISLGGLSAHISSIGIALGILTALSWAVGTVYMKRISVKVDGVWLIAIQSIMGGLIMTGIGSGVEGLSAIAWSTPLLITLLFLALFSVAIAWIIYFHLISTGNASKIASFNFLVPLISILIGILFLDEPFTYSLLAGLFLIIASIYLVNRKSVVLTKRTRANLQAHK